MSALKEIILYGYLIPITYEDQDGRKQESEKLEWLAFDICGYGKLLLDEYGFPLTKTVYLYEELTK